MNFNNNYNLMTQMKNILKMQQEEQYQHFLQSHYFKSHMAQ